jgi:hypothetical protein
MLLVKWDIVARRLEVSGQLPPIGLGKHMSQYRAAVTPSLGMSPDVEDVHRMAIADGLCLRNGEFLN